MQDIGGLRIVLKLDLTGQDKIVSKILDMFAKAKVIDRRESPKHGYRAVHVIALLDERRIEIQLRTQLQDLWAQGGADRSSACHCGAWRDPYLED